MLSRRVDNLRIEERSPTVHQAMAGRGETLLPVSGKHSKHSRSRFSRVAKHSFAVNERPAIATAEPQRAAFAADSFYLSCKEPLFPVVHSVNGELERRRARIHAENGVRHRSGFPPAPVSDFGHILAMQSDVLLVLGQFALAELDQGIGSRL